MPGPAPGGGMDRAWTKPLTSEGNVDSDSPNFDNLVGCHQGVHVSYNVHNPQPGCEYVWERRTMEDMIRVRQQGGQIVQAGDPERSGFEALMGTIDDPDDGLSGTPLDSSTTTRSLVLVRYPAEAVRRKRESERARAEAFQRGGAEDFIARAEALERQYSGGKPSRFRRADHALDLLDDQERPVDRWTPDKGIVPIG